MKPFKFLLSVVAVLGLTLQPVYADDAKPTVVKSPPTVDTTVDDLAELTLSKRFTFADPPDVDELKPLIEVPTTAATSCNSEYALTPFNGCCDANDPRGFTYSWGPDRWAKVGGAVHASYNSVTSNTPGIAGNYFTLNNARLLSSGQVTKQIGFELNSDVSLAQSLSPTTLAQPSQFNLLDAIFKVETGDFFNVWAGQFLPPSDRSNIDGPFYINGWDFPFVSNYPAIFQGRQIGAAYWGQLDGGMLKWSVGAFNGTGGTLQAPFTNPPDTPPNPNGNIQIDARVTVNFLDPEPGYYHQSSYYGQKDILALGFAIQTQQDAVGTAANRADFVGLNLDGLFERKLENDGVITVEGALYRYDDEGLATSSRQGNSGFIYVGYIIPQTITVGSVSGRLRPFSRYQRYNRDFIAASTGLYSQGLDIGTEFVMNGPNARLTAVYSQRDVIGGHLAQIFTLGAQVIF